MGIHFIRNRMPDFLFQCLSLGTPLTRVIIFGIGISVLTFIDVSSLRFPNFCIWEMLFGYCPANGTTRALSAFLHGRWEEAMRYNLNVLAVLPIITSILIMDILKLIKTRKILGMPTTAANTAQTQRTGIKSRKQN